MPAPSHSSCKICDQRAHGNHFGVMSCRACAAFFRRSAVTSFDSFHAICVTAFRNKKMCTILENGRYKCKKCRLKKCYDKGMDPKKFQTDRDLASSTLRSTKPQSMANFLGRPEFILFCEPDKATSTKTLIDVSYLIEKAELVFQKNSLERLTYTMEEMKKSNEKYEIMRKVGRPEALFFWEQAFLGAAQWFSGFPEFTVLDMDVKIEILKSAWLIWARLAKLYETAELQSKKVLESDQFICGQNTCMDMEDLEIDLSWCTNYSKEQLRFYVMSYFDKDWKECVTDLSSLNLTNVEVNFMLIQLCLYDAGKKNQGKVLEATDRLIQIQSDNIHDYYINKMNQPHYSGRLTKMMKLNKTIELDVRTRRERNQLAILFDIFSVDFSHPEMFELT
uniref:Nuclear Hormone Receptor family n=1 Tax=Caenorhabditis tropicalis TaxID=1561998 RepID=A0A1I7TAT5_9PELO